MSAQNLASLNNNKAAQAASTHGQGTAGVTASATAKLTKATATTPPAVAATTRAGSGTTPPERAGGFDRSQVTLLGK